MIIYHIAPETSFVDIAPDPADFTCSQEILFPLYKTPFKIPKGLLDLFIGEMARIPEPVDDSRMYVCPAIHL